MESGGQAGEETGGGPHGLRRFRTRFSPGVSGGGRSTHPLFRAAVRYRMAARSVPQGPFQAPQRRGPALCPRARARGPGSRSSAAGMRMRGGIPVRSFEQRNAPARSGGSDGPPARFSGPRAGSQPPARLARRSAEPVNRRSSAGEPTREAARPRGQRCRSSPAPCFFARRCTRTCISRTRAGRGYGGIRAETRARPLQRPFPGALRRRRTSAKAWTAPPPFGCKHGPSGGKTAAGGRGRPRSSSRRALPAGENGPASRIIPKPAQALPAQIPPESRSNRGKTSSVLHPGNAPAGRITRPANGWTPPRQGAERRSIGG